MDRLTGTVPGYIDTIFQVGCSGHVEMVNSRGIYLLLAGKRILLCHSRFGTVPNGVALDQWDRLPPLLATGQPVQVKEGVLSFSSRAWELRLRSVPKDTKILCPDEKKLGEGIRILLANTKQTGLSALACPLFTEQMPDMNLYCEIALPYVRALLNGLEKENTEDIQRSVLGLLGLGPGLTPSGDDFLSGLLYGLRHSPARDTLPCAFLWDTIKNKARERTNTVSADYLLALADDAPFDRMATAWADPAAGAAGLMQIGSNSGGEMLLGLLCAGMMYGRLHVK